MRTRTVCRKSAAKYAGRLRQVCGKAAASQVCGKAAASKWYYFGLCDHPGQNQSRLVDQFIELLYISVHTCITEIY